MLAAPEYAEKALVGGLLIDATLLPRVIGIAPPSRIHDPACRAVYESITDLSKSTKRVDKVLVAEDLRHRGKLGDIGGPAFLSELLDTVVTTASIDEYARIVARSAAARDVADLCATGRKAILAGEYPEPVLEGIKRACVSVDAGLSGMSGASDPQTVADDFDRRRNEIMSAGIPFGLRRLDEATGGLHAGELVLLGACTSIGKSAFCEKIAATIAVAHRVSFFPLEMGRDRTMRRLTNRGIDIRKLGLFIEEKDNRNPWSLADIWGKVARTGPEVVVVDHAMWITDWDDRAKGERSDMAPTRVVKGLATMAATERVAVILAHQFNREADPDKRPVASYFREAGTIEQIADVALLLHRPKFNDPLHDCELEIIIAKNRDGGRGIVKCWWNGPLQTFDEMANQGEDAA